MEAVKDKMRKDDTAADLSLRLDPTVLDRGPTALIPLVDNGTRLYVHIYSCIL